MYRSLISTLGLLLSCCQHSAWGFAVVGSSLQREATRLTMSTTDEEDSRRVFLTKAAAIAAVGLGSPFLPTDVANAVTGANKVNAKLKG